MPPPITGPIGPHIPAPTFPTGPGGLVRPSDLSGQSLPQGPAGLTGQAPKFRGNSLTMPPRRNALPSLQATPQRDLTAVPSMHGAQSRDLSAAYPYPMPPPGGNPPPLANAALSAAHESGNAAIDSQNAMMDKMQQLNVSAITQQYAMAEMESIKSMATALAKTTKSIGKGVSDLAS
jgi:hypothetical protein